MTGVALTYDVSDLMNGLAGARERLADRRPALRSIARAGVAQTRRRFQVGRGPDGVAWKPGRKKTGQTLILSGLLVRSITDSPPDETGVEWGSNRVYAAVHQDGFDGQVAVSAHSRTVRQIFGRKVSPRVQNVKAHSRKMNMPARPYLGVNAENAEAFSYILLRWIAEGADQ